jgi:hypothetical protein
MGWVVPWRGRGRPERRAGGVAVRKVVALDRQRSFVRAPLRDVLLRMTPRGG